MLNTSKAWLHLSIVDSLQSAEAADSVLAEWGFWVLEPRHLRVSFSQKILARDVIPLWFPYSPANKTEHYQWRAIVCPDVTVWYTPITYWSLFENRRRNTSVIITGHYWYDLIFFHQALKLRLCPVYTTVFELTLMLFCCAGPRATVPRSLSATLYIGMTASSFFSTRLMFSWRFCNEPVCLCTGVMVFSNRSNL